MQQRRIKGISMLCSSWIYPFSVSRRVHDPYCGKPHANITENEFFLMRHSMREPSRMKLQFLPELLFI